MKLVVQVYEGEKKELAEGVLQKLNVKVAEKFDSWGHTGFFGSDFQGINVRAIDTFYICEVPDNSNIEALKVGLMREEYHLLTMPKSWSTETAAVIRHADFDVLQYDPSFEDPTVSPRLDRKNFRVPHRTLTEEARLVREGTIKPVPNHIKLPVGIGKEARTLLEQKLVMEYVTAHGLEKPYTPKELGIKQRSSGLPRRKKE